VVNEPGAFSWSELITPDPAAVVPFYEALFGWTAQTAPMPTGTYTVFHVEGGNDNGIAGAMAPPMDGMPAFWGVYFNVDDAAATVARARQLGAEIVMDATPVPGVGTLATIVDPQGAAFSVMSTT
jgi:predicted enzyme related to lactoylglutathione lyase